MSKIGDFLKELRENKKMSIEEVAAGTGIRAQYLEALENGEYSKIPGDVFIKGFIRNYGNYLGVDGNELVEQYKRHAQAPSPADSSKHSTGQEAEVAAAIAAVTEKQKNAVKRKPGFIENIKNSFQDMKDFIYDNIYETVDDDEDEPSEDEVDSLPEQPMPTAAPTRPQAAPQRPRTVSQPKPQPRPVVYKPAPEQASTPEPVRTFNEPKRSVPEGKGSFFNFKVFAGVFSVCLILFCLMIGYFLFSGSKNPSELVGKGTGLTGTVKSAHSAENGTSKTANKTTGENADKAGAASADDKKTEDSKEQKKDEKTVAAGEGITVEITYKKPVWTQTTVDGKGVEAATIPKGSTRTYKGKEVKVNLGSIRDVEIKVNGKVVPYGEKEWGTVTKTFK